ncbi:hypothetical protein C8R44DRAFT_749213 [Mycena epipterygia]|nr:hypothetical protein C8R44DRAFT_749213 [Mycena epipterygia]
MASVDVALLAVRLYALGGRPLSLGSSAARQRWALRVEDALALTLARLCLDPENACATDPVVSRSGKATYGGKDRRDSATRNNRGDEGVKIMIRRYAHAIGIIEHNRVAIRKIECNLVKSIAGGLPIFQSSCNKTISGLCAECKIVNVIAMTQDTEK